MIKQQLLSTLKITDEQLKEDVIIARHPEHQELFFLILNKKANTFTFDFVRKIHEKLDIVEENPGKTALITTSFHPNIFSGGLDLNFLLPLNQFDRMNFILEFIRLLGRLLSFPLPTIAMLNGHAIAGGCMLSFAHDWRISRAEVGKVNFALNEIEISMYLPPGMCAVVQQKIKPQAFRDLVLLAKRFDGATDGFKEGFVDYLEKEENILSSTIQFALKVAPYGVDKDNHRRIKEEMNKTAINACLNMQMAAGIRGEYYIPKAKL